MDGRPPTQGSVKGRSLLRAATVVFDRPSWGGVALRATTLAIPFGLFALLLNSVLPPSILVASRQSLTPVVALAVVLLACCHSWRGWIGKIAGLSVTLALFALPLAALWQDVAFQGNVIGALLPFSDASGYYYDARRLLDGHLLGWTARRPLFVGLLSTLLALTGQNLQICLAVMVAINAVACFLFARELRESHGAVAAAVGTAVLFLFYRIEGGLGTTLTENLGFALGVCGFAALLRGARDLDAKSLFVGLGLLTVGLISRAGAFFVLPALVLAVGWMFREKRRALWMGGGAIAAILFAAILAAGVGRRLADPASEQTAFSNFSYSLYGLAVGGKGWGQALQDHPTAKEGAEVYALAYRAFLDRPFGLVEGSLKMWREYLAPTRPYHAFAFVRSTATYRRPIQLACFVLSAIALLASLYRTRRPLFALILAASVGHLASIPFVPPIDAGLRVYAATMPILATLIVLGLDVVFQMIGRAYRAVWRLPVVPPPPSHLERPRPRAAELFGAALAAVALAGPLVVLSLSRPPRLVDLKCDAATIPIYVRVSNGSLLRIRDDSHRSDGRSAAIEIGESQLALTAGRVEIGGDASHFTDGNTMFNGYDLKSGRYVWLVVPTDRLRKLPAVYAICGHDSTDERSKNYGVFYAESVWYTAEPKP